MNCLPDGATGKTKGSQRLKVENHYRNGSDKLHTFVAMPLVIFNPLLHLKSCLQGKI